MKIRDLKCNITILTEHRTVWKLIYFNLKYYDCFLHILKDLGRSLMLLESMGDSVPYFSCDNATKNKQKNPVKN